MKTPGLTLICRKPATALRATALAMLFGSFAIAPATAQLITLTPSNVIGSSPWITGNGGTTFDWNSVNASGFQASNIFSQQTGNVSGASANFAGNTWFPSGDIGGTGLSLNNRYVVIDLGAAYTLTSIELFNTTTAQRITGTFDILASNSITGATTEGGFTRGQVLSSPTTLLGSTALTFTNVQDPVAAQSFVVSPGTSYRYLQIDLLTATGFDTGSGIQIFGSGLSEVRIYGTAIPESSTYAAIAGLGALGFVVWQRRRKAVASSVNAAT